MNIEGAIGVIQAKTGLDREGIAKKLGRNASYLSTVKKNPTQKVVNLLNEKFKKELEGFDWNEPSVTIQDAPGSNQEFLIRVLAKINVLFSNEAEKIAQKEGRKVTDVLREMDKAATDEANILYKELLKR